MKYKILGRKKIKALLEEVGIKDVAISQFAIDELNNMIDDILKKILFSGTHWRGTNQRTRLSAIHIKAAIRDYNLDNIKTTIEK